MHKDMPITDNALSSDGTNGEDFKLLVLQKAFNEITQSNNDENKEGEKQ